MMLLPLSWVSVVSWLMVPPQSTSAAAVLAKPRLARDASAAAMAILWADPAQPSTRPRVSSCAGMVRHTF
jgi:hypothetical protein